MRTGLAVLSAFALFLFGWFMLATLLYVLGYVAARAVGGIVMMHYVHLLVIFIVAPGFGGFLATYSTPKLFTTVHAQSIAAGFISIVVTLSVIVAAFALFGFFDGTANVREFLLLCAQVIAVLIGSKIGSFMYGQELS